MPGNDWSFHFSFTRLSDNTSFCSARFQRHLPATFRTTESLQPSPYQVSKALWLSTYSFRTPSCCAFSMFIFMATPSAKCTKLFIKCSTEWCDVAGDVPWCREQPRDRRAVSTRNSNVMLRRWMAVLIPDWLNMFSTLYDVKNKKTHSWEGSETNPCVHKSKLCATVTTDMRDNVTVSITGNPTPLFRFRSAHMKI